MKNMKKVLFCFLCASVIGAGKLKAQVAGIKGGVSLTNVSNINGDDRVTGHVGLFLHQPLSKNFCIQPEILYAPMGEKFTGLTGSKSTLALSYIQVPVMFQYYPVKQFYVELGPQVSFLTDAKVKTDGGNKVNVKDNYTAADFNINFGIGINATRNLGFYGRYNLGVTDITKNDNTTYSNRGFQLGAAVRLK